MKVYGLLNFLISLQILFNKSGRAVARTEHNDSVVLLPVQ